MTVDYNDGQIHGWNGGDRPVHPESFVEYWLQGRVSYTTKAGECRWSNLNDDYDILAFRVVEQHVEPKTIWVNEYPDGAAIHYAEESAKINAGPLATRIAVEYKEVR